MNIFLLDFLYTYKNFFSNKRFGYLLLIFILCSSSVFAQMGKISGRVTDEKNEPLIGVNIFIEGTTQGAATDFEGYYSILNIRPGVYTINFRYIGYQSKILQNVSVNADKTTNLDVTLNPEVIEGETVVIVAQKPVVDFNQTSTVKNVSSEDIKTLPVQSLNDIINLQAGAVQTTDGQFHIRGGRGGEIQFQVDGISINNPFSNEASLNIDRSIIEEVAVVSGTFDAKYGQAMSGVVNTTLKSGSDQFSYSVEIFGGDYLPIDDHRYPNNTDFLPYTVQNYQLTLSGPTGLPNTTFLVSGRRYHNNGFLYGERRFVPTDINDVLDGIVYPTGDNKIVPMNPYDEWSGQFKLTNVSIDNINLSYVGIINYNWGKAYNFDYRLNPDGLKDKSTFSINHGLDFTHTLSNDMFYKLSFRQNLFDFKEYKYESIYDPRYIEADYPIAISGYEYGAIIQGVDYGRNSQKTNSGIAKLDYTWQVNKSNFLEAGVEGQINELKFGPPGQLVIISDSLTGIVRLQPKEIDLNDSRFKKVETYKPTQGAIYFQDRIELGDLVVRAGLRYEYFDPQAFVPSNLQNPANSIIGVPGSVLIPAKVKQTLAPRLGFGFPLTDKSALHFSYGHFYQMPANRELYENANYQVLDFLDGGDTFSDYMGNPDLNPEITVQYEVGLKQALTNDLGFDLTFFYKDIRDLLGTEVVETYDFGRYARNTNVDYGNVSGITFSIIQRPVGNFGASLDYSLMFAAGNSSDPDETANRQLGGEDPRPRSIDFNWDQRHTLNITALYQVPDNFSISTIVRYASGQPYTPELIVSNQTQQEQNSGRKPSYATVDLRGEKYFDFDFAVFSFFFRAFNIFNQYFINGAVYSDTGDPDFSLKLLPGQPIDPNRYAAPRRIEFGISLRSK